MFDGRLILIRSLVERGVEWVKRAAGEFVEEPAGHLNEEPQPAPERPAWMFFLDL